ncbi:hypothetical protein GCM10009642_38550 [Nocardiopsis metallicus]
MRVDRAGLMKLPAAERFRACQQIRTPSTADQVDDIRAQAVLELVEEHGRVHGANAAVGRIIGKSGTFVGQLVAEADRDRETYEKTRARLDREEVEDITGAPQARLRAVHSLESVIDMFLSHAVASAEADDFEAASAGVRMISSTAADTLRILQGEADQERLGEAHDIEEGNAPHQEHTYRLLVSYKKDETGGWVEHSDREWEASNLLAVEEVAEDAGWIITSLTERGGESTPGRVWRLEVWADPTSTGAPDVDHEHVEHTPTDQERLTWELTQRATDEHGNLDTAELRRLMVEHHQTHEKGESA